MNREKKELRLKVTCKNGEITFLCNDLKTISQVWHEVYQRKGWKLNPSKRIFSLRPFGYMYKSTATYDNPTT